MNTQIRTLHVRACDAVPWKSSAQRAAEEAERLETRRRQAEEEEEQKKKKAEMEEEEEEEEEDFLCSQEKRKSLSSQLLPSFVTASRDVDKENAKGRRDVSDGKTSKNDVKIALGAPLKTRVNDVDVVVLHWKKQKAETDDDDEADFVREAEKRKKAATTSLLVKDVPMVASVLLL